MHNSTGRRLFLALSRIDALSPPLLATLSRDELQKAERIASTKRRDEYVWGRSLLRQLLEKVTGRPADSHNIATTKLGKPICISGPSVSISHTHDTVACAVALSGDVGLDVETISTTRDTRRMARLYFSAVEYDWLQKNPESRFYMQWVLKEAYLKALGSGLPAGLDRLECRIDPPVIKAVSGFPVSCALRLYELTGGYLGLATTDVRFSETCVLQWDPALEKLTNSSWLSEIAAGDAYPELSSQREAAPPAIISTSRKLS